MGDDEKKTPIEEATPGHSAAGGEEAKEAASATETAAPVPEAEEKDSTADKPDSASPQKAKASDIQDKKSTEEDTAVTASENEDQEEPPKAISGGDGSKPVAIVASNKKERPPYKYDPDKITLRFLFANKDGLTVTVECKPSDTVGEVKGALLSVWPNDLPDCEGGGLLRLVCMGKGFLMPDTRTLEDLQIPVFKTHPTPVNVSVKLSDKNRAGVDSPTKKGDSGGDGTALTGGNTGADQADQGCACTIL